MQKKTIHLKDYFQPMLLLVLLLALVVFLSIYSDAFMSAKNWRNIFDNHMAHQLLLGIGMTFVIATGGIDLSVGAILALSGIVLGKLLNSDMPIILAIICCLATATAMGGTCWRM